MSLPIKHDLHRLIIDIDYDNSISGSAGGNYRRRSWWSFSKGTDLMSLGRSFCDAVDKMETGYTRAVSPHWIPLGEKIISKLPGKWSVIAAHKIQLNIQQRLIALKRRDFDEVEEELTEEELSKIKDWKEIDQDVLVKYPDFTRLILQSKPLRKRFFTWILRDKLSPESFIEFPKTQELIEKIGIGPSIHKIGPETLQVKWTKLGAKCLTFPLYGKHKGDIGSKPVKLWNQDKIREFHHGYITNLKDVFELIRKKDKKWIDFIVTEKGIENWNVRHWGTLNSKGQIQKIPLTESWYRDVPVIERITVKQARELYGPDEDGNYLDGENFAVVVRATRRRPNLAVVGTHAFFDLCIPDEGGYIIISPGKFSRIIPQTLWELIKIFGDSVTGVVVSHDPSVVHPWREQKRFPVIITEEKFQAFADQMRKSIENGRDGNLVFSIFADSCSAWVQKLTDWLYKSMGKEERDFFTMKISDTEPSKGLLKNLMDFVKRFPVSIQPFMTYLVLLCFYPFRSIVVEEDGEYRKISCIACDNFNNSTIGIPAKLFLLE